MVKIYKVLFCVMRPCGLADRYHCCEGTCCIFLWLFLYCPYSKMSHFTSVVQIEAAVSSKAFASIYQIPRCKIPEDQKSPLPIIVSLYALNLQKSHLLRPSKFSSCTPIPLSITSTSSLPYSLRRTSITLAPASKLFSTSSFTAVAKVRTTWEVDYYTVKIFYLSYHKFRCIRWSVISYK